MKDRHQSSCSFIKMVQGTVRNGFYDRTIRDPSELNLLLISISAGSTDQRMTNGCATWKKLAKTQRFPISRIGALCALSAMMPNGFESHTFPTIQSFQEKKSGRLTPRHRLDPLRKFRTRKSEQNFCFNLIIWGKYTKGAEMKNRSEYFMTA